MRRLRPLPIVCALILGSTSLAVPAAGAPAEGETAQNTGRQNTGQKPDGPNTSSQEQTLPGGAKRGVLQGRIDAVNPDEGAIVIAPADREERVSARIAAGVPVFLEGRLDDRKALKEGQQVRASYEVRDGKTRLRWVEVHDADTPDAPPGTGGSREGVGGTPGGAHSPSGQGIPRDQTLPIQRTASSDDSGDNPNDPAPTPPTAPQGSTGIHGGQLPGDQYEGEGQGSDDAVRSDEEESESPERAGASGVQETEEMFAPTTPPGQRGQPGLNEVDGVVVRANVADNELVIDQEGKSLTLRVPAGAPVIIEGRRGTLDSLEAGTPVRASLATEDESPIAVWVETIDRVPAKGSERQTGGDSATD